MVNKRVRWDKLHASADVVCQPVWRTVNGWEIDRLQHAGTRPTYHPKQRDAHGEEIAWLGCHHTIADAKAAVERQIAVSS